MSLSVILPAFVLLVSGAGRGAQAKYLCSESLTCTAVGYFSRCDNFCDTQYFACDAVGDQATLFTCPGETVFDPDPGHPFCVPFDNCTTNTCHTLPLFSCQGFYTYPRCDNCSQDFFLCSSTGQLPRRETCAAGMLYNPVPSLRGCIPASECPCTTDDC
ncbi:uncharacterized protein LOC127009901 [Eriocheir sinensis]|uniref:uncharacterized protein LOC127009901 n=1 Tax=Eriocheir sinensis TaxID=95602 RepID=UPI0021C5D8E5|nr:uncharacterized protein LOC127009901 [Eriocheir sinensis]